MAHKDFKIMKKVNERRLTKVLEAEEFESDNGTAFDIDKS